MFLFLSKLLPLFIYPLGLSCLLMIGALILLWKHPRWAAISIAVALIILLAGSNRWVSQSLIQSLEWQNLPSGELPKAEAIVVLGGGTKPAIPPRPWVDVSEAGDRILYGSRLYQQGKAPWLILSGGRIEWQGKAPSESADMAEIAKAMGVRGAAILRWRCVEQARFIRGIALRGSQIYLAVCMLAMMWIINIFKYSFAAYFSGCIEHIRVCPQARKF